jgi:hypothetical protein
MPGIETIQGRVTGSNAILYQGREQENWTYAIDLAKVLHLLDLELLS